MLPGNPAELVERLQLRRVPELHFTAGSFPRAPRAHRAALEGNEEGQSARALRFSVDQLSFSVQKQREASMAAILRFEPRAEAEQGTQSS